MPRSSALTWLIALQLAIAAHAGVFWLSGQFASTAQVAAPQVLAVEIQAPQAVASPAETPSVAANPPAPAPAPTDPLRQSSTVPAKPPKPPAPNQQVRTEAPAETQAKAPPAPARTETAHVPPPAAPPLSTPTRAQELLTDDLQPPEALVASPQPTPPPTQASLAMPLPSAPVPSASPQESGEYWDQVRQALEQAKEYPLLSRRRRETGTVVIELELDATGGILAHELVEPSRYPRLNQAVETMLARATPLPPPTDTSARSVRLRYRIAFGLE